MSGDTGPPPLRPFGLVLHHDGRFSHEGFPIANRRLREHFERSVEYLSAERKFIVRLRHFRGEIEVEEAGFFVRSIDLETGGIGLSDGRHEILDASTLSLSPIDGAILCRIRCDTLAGGLLARFSHSTQAEFLQAIEDREDGLHVIIGGRAIPCPGLE
ncbi:MAG TPA: hypothetical protein ENI85_16360 [Deltaproteobacteria bacterium]|nr:hypothetical protein [Deltaproteobacteria bacterium]